MTEFYTCDQIECTNRRKITIEDDGPIFELSQGESDGDNMGSSFPTAFTVIGHLVCCMFCRHLNRDINLFQNLKGEDK